MIDYYAVQSWRMAPVIPQYTKRDSIIDNLGIGAGRGALLVLAKDLSDADREVAYATVHSKIFLRNDGGFDGATDFPPSRRQFRATPRTGYRCSTEGNVVLNNGLFEYE